MAFSDNLLKAYQEIHGDHQVLTKEEDEMRFHGTQKPWEFFKAWEIIEQYIPQKQDLYFLEIGAAKGLWSIAFIEFCKLHNKTPHYVTVNWTNPPYIEPHERAWNDSLINVKNYYQDICKHWVWIDEDSRKQETKDLVLKESEMFDYVFIDGYHTYEAVLEDTKLYKPLASQLLMYHDIHGRYARGNGVLKAIEDSQTPLDYEIISYRVFKKRDTDGEGIGIHVIDRNNVKVIDGLK